MGVHGCSDPRKNEYYHEVDLTSPILPAAQDLLPLLHDGLKLLYNDYEAESFLLRAKPDGAVPLSNTLALFAPSYSRMPPRSDSSPLMTTARLSCGVGASRCGATSL